MKTSCLVGVLFLLAVAAVAAQHTQFVGSWQFAGKEEENVGMMSQMKMLQTIEQTNAALDIATHATFQGKDDDSKTHYDLTGESGNQRVSYGGL